MSPLEKLLEKLSGAKKAGNSWSARCPAHDDQKASLSISSVDDGIVLVKCHAGCGTSNILRAVGMKLADLFPAKHVPTKTTNPKTKTGSFATAEEAIAKLEQKHGKSSALWWYQDSDGNPVGVVVRWNKSNGKEIRPIARGGQRWRIGAMSDPRPLYALPKLGKTTRVVVAEGEKTADKARTLGFVATTSAGGSQAANKTDWSPLAGKEVWILPDNDAPGRKYAETVAGILGNLTPAAMVSIVELPDLPERGDIVDWIDAHGEAAEPKGMRAEIEEFVRDFERWQPDREENLTYRPFPIEVLPKRIRSFIALGAEAICCDPSFLALPLLTLLASAIGNSRRLELKEGWYVPPILWTAIVGESGSSKTPAFNLVMKPIQLIQQKAFEHYQEELQQFEIKRARWEKDFAIWKREKKDKGDPPEKPEPPQCRRFFVSDTTVEALAPILLDNPRGLLLTRDELAGWIGSFDRYAGKGKTGTDSASWLSMYNAGFVSVDRKTGIPRTIYVPQAAVCVCGGIQPGILKRALSAEHRESGLAARLLLTCPPRKAKQWTETGIAPKAEAELIELVDKLFDLQPGRYEDGRARPILIRPSPSAKAAWIRYFKAHAQEQVNETGDVAAAWSKLEEIPARLALVIHFVRWAANDRTLSDVDTLDEVSMKTGITLAKWFKKETKRVYTMLAETEEEGDQRRLVEWIERKGGCVTAREVQQGCRWLKEPGLAEGALETLVKAGRGVWDPFQAGKRGQPSRRFRLSTVYGNSVNPEENSNTVDVDIVDNQGSDPLPAPKTADVDTIAKDFSQETMFGSESGPYQ